MTLKTETLLVHIVDDDVGAQGAVADHVSLVGYAEVGAGGSDLTCRIAAGLN